MGAVAVSGVEPLSVTRGDTPPHPPVEKGDTRHGPQPLPPTPRTGVNVTGTTGCIGKGGGKGVPQTSPWIWGAAPGFGVPPTPFLPRRTPTTTMLSRSRWALLFLCVTAGFFGWLGLGTLPEELGTPPRAGDPPPHIPFEVTTGDDRFQAEATSWELLPLDSCHCQVWPWGSLLGNGGPQDPSPWATALPGVGCPVLAWDGFFGGGGGRPSAGVGSHLSPYFTPKTNLSVPPPWPCQEHPWVLSSADTSAAARSWCGSARPVPT